MPTSFKLTPLSRRKSQGIRYYQAPSHTFPKFKKWQSKERKEKQLVFDVQRASCADWDGESSASVDQLGSTLIPYASRRQPPLYGPHPRPRLTAPEPTSAASLQEVAPLHLSLVSPGTYIFDGCPLTLESLKLLTKHSQFEKTIFLKYLFSFSAAPGNPQRKRLWSTKESVSEALKEHLTYLEGSNTFDDQTLSQLVAFEAAKQQRNELLLSLTSKTEFPELWSKSIGVDTVVGPISDIGNKVPCDKFSSSSPRCSKISSMVLTTFPVHCNMYASRNSAGGSYNGLSVLPAKVKLAHTARRIKDFELVEPENGEHRLWFDSNPFERKADIKTEQTNPLQFLAFYLSMLSWSCLSFKYIHLAQAANAHWLGCVMTPTHFIPTKDMKKSLNLKDLLGMGADALDECWQWQSILDSTPLDDSLKVTSIQIEAYYRLNTTDVQQFLNVQPQPRAIFVRRFRGKSNQLFFLSRHPCNMDQCQYSQVIYDTAVRENEAIYFGLLRLHALFNTREQNILLDSHLKVLDKPLGPERTLFHTLYDMGFKGQVFLQTMKAGSTVMAVRQLRYFERQRGRAIPYEEFSTCLQEMVDRHVPAASQQDYCPISSKKPPSIIGDLLTYFISYNVIGSGAREGRLHKFKAGLINVGFQELNKQYSKFFTPEQDEIILKRMYEDDRWELKLRKMYGLTKEEATSEKRFRLAAATVLHQNFGTSFSQPEWQRGRLVSVEDLEDKVAAWTAATSLGHCGDSAIWWWTAHGPGLHCWIGFHSTGKATNDGRTVHTVSRLSGLSGRFTEPASSPPCDDCASKGLPQCFMRYSDAVRHGFIEKVLGRALCLRLIKLLSSRIRRVLERKPELGAFELNVMCDWAEQMEMGEKLESWEEDENHLIES